VKLKWQKVSSYALLCISGLFMALGQFVSPLFDILTAIFIVMLGIKVLQDVKQIKK